MESKKKRCLLYLFNIIVGLIMISPILYALNISLMTSDEIFSYPPKFVPASITLDNYKQVIETVPIFRFIFNSFLVSAVVTIGQIITSCLAAYAFSYFNFKANLP